MFKNSQGVEIYCVAYKTEEVYYIYKIDLVSLTIIRNGEDGLIFPSFEIDVTPRKDKSILICNCIFTCGTNQKY